jgi:short-subunit dehydrogenase
MKNVALITGASTGIGKEFAKIHASKGGDLVIVARSESKLNKLKKELETQYKVQVLVIVKDLTKIEATHEIVEQLDKEGIEVDYLINNAGYGGIGKFHERDMMADINMINLNIVALTALTKLILPKMVQRNNGKILNVSSTASLMPGPLQAVYFATKAFVTYLSNAIAEELSDTKVTVTNLMPGATESEFAKVSGMENTELFNKTATANSVALDGYNGMLKGKLDVISGVTTSQKLMSYMIPLTPKKTLLKQIRKMQEVKSV